jgi:hypothetical protein
MRDAMEQLIANSADDCERGRGTTCNDRAARDVRRPAEFQGAVRAGVRITPGIDMTDQMFLVMTLTLTPDRC